VTTALEFVGDVKRSVKRAAGQEGPPMATAPSRVTTTWEDMKIGITTNKNAATTANPKVGFVI